MHGYTSTFDNSNSTHARREVQRPVYQSRFRHSRSKSHLPCNRYALAPRNPDTCQKHDRRPNKEFTWNVRIYTHRQSVKRRRLAATSGIREISGNASLRWSMWRYVPPANKETRARETSNDDPNRYSDVSSIHLNKKKIDANFAISNFFRNVETTSGTLVDSCNLTSDKMAD